MGVIFLLLGQVYYYNIRKIVWRYRILSYDLVVHLHKLQEFLDFL